MTRESTRRHGTPQTRRRFLSTVSIGTMGAVLAGCGGTQIVTPPQSGGEDSTADLPDYSARFAEFAAADEPNGDLSKVVWPEWMAQFDPEVKRLYEFQILNGPLMRYMPCFCGCHLVDGHQNNRDCYVKSINPDGSVVFDSMAPT